MGWLPPPFWLRGWLKVSFLILIQTTGAHHEIYKTTRVYIEKKNLCLSNKHLVIFWVISIGHAYNFLFPIVTRLFFILFFYFIYFL